MKSAGLINEEYARTVIKKRPEEVHKYNFGKIMIAAGSEGMAGAAVLSGGAAIRTGSGLVKVCTDRSNFPVVQISVPENICTTWSREKAVLDQYDAIAAGPGMEPGHRTKQVITGILRKYGGTVILDAGALSTVAKYNELAKLVRETDASVIMTPHTGEAAKLLGKATLKGLGKIEIAERLVDKYKCTVVVKGHETIVAVSDNEAYTNTSGNPGMATAGSGDVLTGVIASLAGQGLTQSEAARAGVYVHGLAGDLAAQAVGEHGMTAGDIIKYLPFALKKISE